MAQATDTTDAQEGNWKDFTKQNPFHLPVP